MRTSCKHTWAQTSHLPKTRKQQQRQTRPQVSGLLWDWRLLASLQKRRKRRLQSAIATFQSQIARCRLPSQEDYPMALATATYSRTKSHCKRLQWRSTFAKRRKGRRSVRRGGKPRRPAGTLMPQLSRRRMRQRMRTKTIHSTTRSLPLIPKKLQRPPSPSRRSLRKQRRRQSKSSRIRRPQLSARTWSCLWQTKTTPSCAIST